MQAFTKAEHGTPQIKRTLCEEPPPFTWDFPEISTCEMGTNWHQDHLTC